jgi:hypothetical protein
MIEQMFDLWPLPWWKNPWWLSGVSLIAFCCMMICAYGVMRFLKRKRIPRPMSEQLAVRLQSLRLLPLVHDYERCCVYVELMQMMREYAQHVFDINSDGMTDIEFLKMLESKGVRDSSEEFMNIVEMMSDEVSLAKFAARPISRDIMFAHISLLSAYFSSRQQVDRHIISK